MKYLTVMARFTKYSWNNLLLIALQRPAASHVAGFHTWRKLGRHVRKGSKGIAILAPMVYRKKADRDDAEEQQGRIFGFRTAYVFDVADTDGQDLPDLPSVSGDPEHYTQRLIEFIQSNGITLEYSDTIAPAKGLSKGGAIVILPGLSPAETLSVMAHECGHELLHRGERRGATNKTVRETEAEAVAFVVCHEIGLETGSAAADYIAVWQGDKAKLAESLQFIQSAAIRILTAIGAAEDRSHATEAL